VAGRVSEVSGECGGVNYSLRFRERAIKVRGRLLQHTAVTIEMGRIKSIELLRKSVMPPAMIGVVCLSLGLILRITEEEWVAVVPIGLRNSLQYLLIGTAGICLAILLSRWFFSDLILKPLDASPITVRMLPTSSARRFVMLIQSEIRDTEPI
jgi:hypothetical protein